ncbi:sensor histidine kinase [Photobacterium sp. Hal280]|uniref:sensor histidine kinase n=1 Tax=Photobacterium sp. Hal280 TaxID=3035163 RepID=UPI00301D2507
MSSDIRAEQATRCAQRALFRRFLLTLFCCFLLIVTVMALVLTYQLDDQERKLLESYGQEYQRILTFESDAKFEHVVVSNPNRLIENAVSVSKETITGELEWVSGAAPATLPDAPSAYRLPDRLWYHLFSDAPYLTLELSGKPTRYWLVMDGSPRRSQLFRQGSWLIVALAVMVTVMSLVVWQLLSRTLLPLHNLAKSVDQISSGSLDAILDTDLPPPEAKGQFGQLSRSVQQVLNRLKEAIRGMDNTVDAIAHDVRTPLSRIILTTEAALSENRSDNESEQSQYKLAAALSDCAESAQKASQMLTTLMRIHDEQAGRHPCQLAPVNLASLLAEVAAWYEEVADEAGLSFNTSALQPVMLQSDAKRLTQIVVNLLDNSLKYSQPGGEITLLCGEENGRVWFSVSDQGIGIAKAHHALIFRRLYRVEASRHQPGYGLGLPFVAAMVKTLQGSVDLDSEAGKGSRFTVRLPKTTEGDISPTQVQNPD